MINGSYFLMCFLRFIKFIYSIIISNFLESLYSLMICLNFIVDYVMPFDYFQLIILYDLRV